MIVEGSKMREAARMHSVWAIGEPYLRADPDYKPEGAATYDWHFAVMTTKDPIVFDFETSKAAHQGASYFTAGVSGFPRLYRRV